VSPPVLELLDVRKRFGRSRPWVLDGVNLAVEPGEVVQIAGVNGSGKTTLLRVAAGLARAGDGRVQRRGRATYVPDRAPAAAPMTVRVQLTHHARMQGVAGRHLAAEVARVIESQHLEPVADVRFEELSKGWAQRALLAQALLSEPAIVYLDEPWSGIDQVSHDHLTAVLDHARRDGRALLMTSHEPNPMPALRRLELVDGRLVDASASAGAPTDAVAPRTRRVWVVSRHGDAGIPGRLREHAGLVDAARDGEGVVVTIVDDPTGDALLVRLLEIGWTPVRIDGTES
jgi:ABC-type multidrug transport system ATPase subunit